MEPGKNLGECPRIVKDNRFEPATLEPPRLVPHPTKDHTMTEVYGPDFITLLVADLDASVRFYKDKIGLKASPEKQPHAQAPAVLPMAVAVVEPALGASLVPDWPPFAAAVVPCLRSSPSSTAAPGRRSGTDRTTAPQASARQKRCR